MQVAIALLALVAIASCAPTTKLPPSPTTKLSPSRINRAAANPDADALILRQEQENIGVDGFNWSLETSNGISQEEVGTLTNAGSENEAIAVRGSFKYTGADGVVYSVSYVADENGFQPSGEHLPVAPE